MPVSKHISEIQIEPLEMKHAPAIQKYAADPDIAATTHIPHPYPEGAAVRYIERVMKERKEGVSFIYAVCAGDRFVGVCGVGNRANLWYWIGKPHWGRGYGTAGARAVLTRVFNEGPFETINSRSLVHNIGSVRILEKCGFQPVEPPPYKVEADPPGEIAWYAVTKEQFQQKMEESEKSKESEERS